MIRVILTIEQKGGDVHIKFETDGVQKGYTTKESIVLQNLRQVIRLAVGEPVASVEYTKDLPPSGGRKQQT